MFLPIAILAYAFNAGSTLVDKILLRTTFQNPIVYTFYINLLQLLVLLLIPFGFHPILDRATYLAAASGILGIVAFYAYFSSLQKNEASIVGLTVGMFNPLSALILGGLFLGQILTATQYLAFFVLISGTIVLTVDLWHGKIQFGRKFLWMLVSGFFFGLSSVLLREAFLESSFLNGFIVSRAAAGLFVLPLLLFPKIRRCIFESRKLNHELQSKSTLLLMGSGQIMGALSSTLATIATYFANPALVNSLFGVQYLVILIASLLLVKKYPHLLREKLSKRAIAHKIAGAVIISLGLYLISR